MTDIAVMQDGTPRHVRLLTRVALLSGAGGLLLVGFMISGPTIEGARLEALKILLQFLLVTGVGGAIALFLNSLKDRDAQRLADAREREARDRAEAKENAAHLAARVAALQSLDRELGGVYRSLKAAKRELRSTIIEADRDEKGRATAPYTFPTAAFRKCMSDMLAAQIKAEDIRDLVSVRADLFDDQPLRDRLRDRLHYAARFFHDVFQDVERGKVTFDGETCRVDARCCNIDSLLNGRDYPDLRPEVKAALRAYLDAPDDMPIGERHAAFDRIDQVRKLDKPEKRRFRAIADDSFALASAEIRSVIARLTGGEPDTAAFRAPREYDVERDRAVASG